MTADTIIRRRLAAQHLVGKGLADAVAVVRELSAVQSQDYAGAKWALSQRIAGAGAADAIIEQEIDRGAILRTHLLRPTWHFVAPEDLRWILALTGHRVNAVMGRNDKEFGLSDAVYAHSQEVMAKALSGGKHLTRTEIKAAMERAKIRVVNGQALARLMMRAEQAAVIVSGARRGKQFTYALVDERVKPTKPKERDEALGELMRRYFATRGPATAHDAAWWSGLTLADVTRGIHVAGKAIQNVEIDGREYWSGERATPKATPSAHLLPNYDEYFIGYRDRSAIGHRIGGVSRVTGGNALIANVICVDGELVGGWKRQGKTIKLDVVAKLTPPERARVGEQVERLAQHVGGKIVVKK